MKKLVLVMVLFFAFSGCSSETNATPEDVAKAYKRDFSAAAKTVFKDMDTEMDIAKNGMSINIVLDSPKEVSGMGIEIFDEHAKISYEGMEQEIKTDSLPEGTPFLLLKDLFDELSDPEDFTLSTENEKLVAKGEDFSAVLSPEDFSLISAEFPFYETKFTFSNFAFAAAE